MIDVVISLLASAAILASAFGYDEIAFILAAAGFVYTMSVVDTSDWEKIEPPDDWDDQE